MIADEELRGYDHVVDAWTASISRCRGRRMDVKPGDAMTDMPNTSRRHFLTVAGASTAAALFAPQQIVAERLGVERDDTPHLGPSSLKFDKNDTAVVFIDPQNDVLSEKGLAWSAVRESLKENNTIENMERLFKTAKARGFETFISPHYFYPTDKGWKFNGPLETDEATSGLFARKGVLNLDGLKGSGADWLERFKPYIEDGKTIVVSPHRVWGPQTNDLVLQLRKRRISQIILGGMLANMCVESHLREFLEQGFEVAIVKDATAGPRHPEWGDGYKAAMINYAFLAHAVLTTDETVKAMEHGQR
jgi:nicotinamidase-related amidase